LDPKLARFKKGDTDYAFSLIPLGGYVKMFGDDPLSKEELTEAEKAVAFTHKSKWARFWIVFGGPLANFILAFFLYFTLLLSGENVPQPRLGEIPQNTLYYQEGLRSGDVLLEINGNKVTSFDDITGVDGFIKQIVVERGDKDVTLNLNIDSNAFITEFPKITGQLRAPVVTGVDGVLYYLSTTQDKVTEYTLEQLNEGQFNEVYLVPIKNADEINVKNLEYDFSKVKQLPLTKQLFEELRENKLYPVDLQVQSIVMESAAEAAGIKKGDIIINIDGKPIYGFMILRNILNTMKENKELKVTIMRGDKQLIKGLKPKEQVVGGKKGYYIGIYSSLRAQPIKMVKTDSKGFFTSIGLAWGRTADGFSKTLVGFKKLIFGEVSVKNLGGPIAIGKVASDSFYISWSMFLRLMAIISINLGLINLFPIPVLDGGHIVFIGLEVLNGGPLSHKKMQIAQQFGMSLLFLLIFVALFNDISRLVG
jgi:regulator of sigma E protease